MSNVFAATQSHNNAINFVELKDYAKLSYATYLTESRIHKVNFSNDYKVTHYNNSPGTKITYYLATNDITKTQVIAVRGTTNVENAFVDIALKLTLDKHLGIRLHTGFSEASQQIYSDIRPLIKPGYVVNTTGHSLGGAIAMVLAMHLDTDNYKVGKVITFGQPKITNISGANKFQHLNITRVVTPKDLVPLVPPFDLVDIDNIDVYWHLGKEVVLLPNTTYSTLEGLDSMIRVTKFTQEPLTENNLDDHHISLYIALINKKIPVSKLVPFKNNLNLFNLFGVE